MAGLSSSMYPGSYPRSDQNPYPSISMENSASAAYFGSLVSDEYAQLADTLKDSAHWICLDMLSVREKSNLCIHWTPLEFVH